MSLDFKYSSKFLATASAVKLGGEQKNLATASLKNLAGVFDDDVIEDIENNPDLLFISSNLILLNSVNLNDDGIFAEDIVPVSNLFVNKFINENHNREGGGYGAISAVGFSRAGTNERVNEENAIDLSKTEPIQLVIGGYMWRLIDKDLCKAIEESSYNEDSKISVSFEILFNNYDIAICKGTDRNLFTAKIIKEGDESWEKYNKALRCNEGPGVIDGNIISRVLRPAILPAGAGIVETPASGIRGILAVEPAMIMPEPEDDDEDEDELSEGIINLLKATPEYGMGFHMCDMEMEDGSILPNIPVYNCSKVPPYIRAKSVKSVKPIEKIIKPEKISVSAIKPTNIIMEIKTIEDIKQDLFKNEATANEVRDFIKSKYVDHAEKFATERAALENQAKAAVEAKVAAEALAAELREKMITLEKEITEVREAQAAAEAEQAFALRIGQLDEVFDLDDEDRAFLVEEIKAIENEEAFAKFMGKQKKLMKEKTKAYKDEMKKKGACAADKAALDAAAALASVKENEGQDISNGVTATETLSEKFQSAFRSSISVGGKKIEKE